MFINMVFCWIPSCFVALWLLVVIVRRNLHAVLGCILSLLAGAAGASRCRQRYSGHRRFVPCLLALGAVVAVALGFLSETSSVTMSSIRRDSSRRRVMEVRRSYHALWNEGPMPSARDVPWAAAFAASSA